MLRWTDFLGVDAIRPSLRARNRDEVLAELAELLAPRAGVPVRELAARLLEREQLGSTAMVGGVAVPHCRIARVPGIITCVGFHRGGLAFGEPEDGLIRIFVGLVSPPDTAGLHLNVLARIAGMLHAASLREALLRAPSATAVHALLVESEQALVSSRAEAAQAR
ncbi:PTS sugar transporter subunit IIA [Pyxidicoccus sp. MSG2]|uniref:PTS sugar transporter subunit IIA n=1 Tax=Pyxidicoccus sp. MSG2 TaxID=2996790 RepID=UPI00226D5B6D|nr:PTS sugar transporter subunit IIA [Pyxidicoccus sp. MSG2]MCY1017972.1 PTS sugar transporter subunit IIA [Pyxidicoccus sp. MSG2]